MDKWIKDELKKVYDLNVSSYMNAVSMLSHHEDEAKRYATVARECLAKETALVSEYPWVITWTG